jgi:hypothetical protein
MRCGWWWLWSSASPLWLVALSFWTPIKAMTTIPPKNPEGRPRAVIDLLAVERAASVGCPIDDIAAILGICRATFYNHMERDPAIAEAIARGRGQGRGSVRRAQFEKAMGGSDTMLIWLGKVLCDQKETSAVVVAGPNGGPAKVERVIIPTNDPIEAARVYQKFMAGD